MKCSSKTKVNNIFFRPVQDGHSNLDYFWKIYYRWLTHCNFVIVWLWVLKICSLMLQMLLFKIKSFLWQYLWIFIFQNLIFFLCVYSDNMCVYVMAYMYTQQICLLHPTREQDSIHTVTQTDSYKLREIHINTNFSQNQYHSGISYL